MSWLEKLVPTQARGENGNKRSIPEGLWTKCESCASVLYEAELDRNLNVCPKCGLHRNITARQRLDLFLDQDGRKEISGHVESGDPLKFRDSRKYRERYAQAQKKTGEKDALVVYQGRLKGLPLVASSFNFNFMGGSMGSAVGELFVQGVNTAVGNGLPLVSFSASGGARMQEGLLSLMQMAKTSAALARLGERGLPYISVLTNPTTGGVAASLAMLGDVNIAEPKALIGFAGQRVIEQTVRQTLPEGFQRSEFLLEHGAVDLILSRHDMRDRIHGMLSMMMGGHAPTEDPGSDTV